MFKNFEVRPVVLADNGEVTPCLTLKEAKAYAEEEDGIVAFGLYGQEADDTWQHIADRMSEEAMVELIGNLLGVALKWGSSDRIEFARPVPAVVVEINGGAIYTARATTPVRTVILDEDIEGSDGERVMIINGQEAYVHDYRLDTAVSDTDDGLDPDYVMLVLAQIDLAEKGAS